jgi:2-polyprenyl-3-methyl-5-hydroxy-6-metoxy-1,4-benzoquinol methylase
MREPIEQLDAAAEAGRDDWDQHWVDYAGAAAINPAQQYRQDLIVRLLEREKPQRVLDIGSGTGDLAAAVRAALPRAEVLGLELSRAGVELARRKVPGAKFVQRDLMAAEPPPDEYRSWATNAVCSEVLEHVENPKALLANARSYLAPGCRLIVTVPGGPMSAFDRHIGHRRHFTAKSMRALLEQAGFVVERSTRAGFPFFNLYRLIVLLRGERLVDDVARGAGPRRARLVMRIFGVLFRLNLTRSPWGWQVLAAARVPGRRS